MTAAREQRRDAFMRSIGPAIRRRRAELGMSQTLFAAVIESNVSHVSRAESGRYGISLESLFRYAEGLGTTPSALLALAEQLAAEPASLAS